RTGSNSGPGPDLEFAGGPFRLGAERSEERFIFDNEKWAHEVELKPFAIAARPVTNGEYLRYVEAGGKAPRYLRQAHGEWQPRRVAAASFRNFYMPDRGDVFAGFRTCRIDSP